MNINNASWATVAIVRSLADDKELAAAFNAMCDVAWCAAADGGYGGLSKSFNAQYDLAESFREYMTNLASDEKPLWQNHIVASLRQVNWVALADEQLKSHLDYDPCPSEHPCPSGYQCCN